MQGRVSYREYAELTEAEQYFGKTCAMLGISCRRGLGFYMVCPKGLSDHFVSLDHKHNTTETVRSVRTFLKKVKKCHG